MREIVQAYAVKSDFIVVPLKEESRMADMPFTYRQNLSTEKDISEYDHFFFEYRYWGHDILIIRKEKKDSNFLPSIPNGTAIKNITKFKTNKKGDSISVSIFSPSKIASIKQDHDCVISDKNLFKNSNFELQQNESEVIKMLRNWEGAFFYKTPFVLPQSIYLSTQLPIKTPFYPIVFSEMDSPIEGKYSLHAKFNYDSFSESDCYVGLFHNIKSLPGAFTFFAKAVKPKSQLIFTKTDVDSHGKWLARSRYYILLNDTQTHFFSLRFDSYLPANYMFFIMQGVSADVVLDCIQFIPD